MVIHFEWHQTAMEQNSRSSLPLTGEDTGLEALASPLVGYLGKVQQRASSLEHCPWCSSKGLTYGLRLYRINLQESIALCTNLECLFPLVSRPLEDVLASLVPAEPPVGSKRKHSTALEQEEFIKSAQKRLRSDEPYTLPSQEECGPVNGDNNGSAKKVDEQVNGYLRDFSVTTELDSLQNEDNDLDTETEACKDVFTPSMCSVSAGQLQSSSGTLFTTDVVEPVLSPHTGTSEVNSGFDQLRSRPQTLNRCCTRDPQQSVDANERISSNETTTVSPQLNTHAGSTSQNSPRAGIPLCKEAQGFRIPSQDSSSTAIIRSVELVPLPNKLFWSNSNNLCWLDSMLVALVNCKRLRKHRPKNEPRESSVWQLIRGYDAVCAAVQGHRQPGRDGTMRVPQDVLQKAHEDLQSLRMSIFKLLQPKLQCKLGQRETPVFALPLLLAKDSWAEPLFQSTFHWEFRCSGCQIVMKERVTKTLPTFTNILPEWSPLNAVHLAPCNACYRKNQRRTLMLERAPPVFALHFVEGLPDNNIRNYSFTFKGMHYSVTTVIQYNQQLKHFVTWIANSDGSWLEYDDLKHQECKTHRTFPVRAQEIHIVFWEGEQVEECPTRTLTVSPSLKTQVNLSHSDSMLEEPLEHSVLIPHNDTDIVDALSAAEEGDGHAMDTTATVDTSIGSMTLLDTFEGLTHNDIVTLTLVEIKPDSDSQLINNMEQSQEPSRPGCNKGLNSPDSSSGVADGEITNGIHAELPTASDTSEPEDGSASKPTSMPAARRGQAKPVVREPHKKPSLSQAAPQISSLTNGVSSRSVTQANMLPLESTQEASPVSSTNHSLLSAAQASPPTMQAPLQTSRWCFLLSKHPLQAVNKPDNKLPPSPLTKSKPHLLAHSTPNPVRRPGPVFPKPQLKIEANEGLPVKAAEMYDGFGVKNAPSLLQPSLEHLGGKLKPSQPITSHHQNPKNTIVATGTSLAAPGAKGFLEISSSKKRSSHSSKVPPGLNETEALRYKLIKKLKAKKKKLAKLNQILGHQDAASLRPDSTNAGSPNTVTSSTYDSSICDDILLDLLSPATTASNLSPDSTGFLEMLTNGQEGTDQSNVRVAAAPQVSACHTEDFLEDFLSQAVAQRPTEMEAEALSALDLFV